MTTIKTNDRFDTLTNLDISTHYRDREYWFSLSSLTGAFAYWAVAQSPYDTPDISIPLCAFSSYIKKYFKNAELPEEFAYASLGKIINEDAFEGIPEIEQLNHCRISSGSGYDNRYNNPHPDYDFIDLGALARNVFYMLLRENITQSS